KYAPWSYWLTGKLDNTNPGWDPLKFMIAETHKRNLEFHAWFNPYRGTSPVESFGTGTDISKLPANHALRQHPQWAVAWPSAEGQLYFNPGIPEARAYIEDSIMEPVTGYDIDGVHFDDFFYPYPDGGPDFNDAATYTKYGKGFANKG